MHTRLMRTRQTVLVVALLAASLAGALRPPAVAQAQTSSKRWMLEGPAGLTPAEAWYTSLALSDKLTPYLAYVDDAYGGRVSVRKYYGTGWRDVGTPGFSPHPADRTQLAIDSQGRPWVAFEDADLGDAATVMSFDGTTWQLVGAAGFSAGSASSLKFKLDANDVPYVAFINGSEQVRVMKYEPGLGWHGVGGTGGNGFPGAAAQEVSLALDNSNRPYVAFNDSAHSSASTVMRFDGTSWVLVGAAGFSIKTAQYISLALDSQDKPYLAYQDAQVYPSLSATVQVFNGASWQALGTAGFSRGKASFLSLMLDEHDVPYVAFVDEGNNNRAKVMTYAPLTDWTDVGTAGFSEGAAQSTTLALDKNGAPWVAYTDLPHDAKATVMRYQRPDILKPLITLTNPGISRAPTGWFNRASSGSSGSITVRATAAYQGYSETKILNISCVDGSDRIVLSQDSPSGTTALAGDFALSEGTHSIECMATDNDGNIGRDENTIEMPVAYNIDQTPPTLAPSVSPNPSLQYYPATATAHGTDSASGIGSQVCDAVDTSHAGTFTVACTVADVAGNTATASASYSVQAVTIGAIQLESGPITLPVGASHAFTAKVLNNNGAELAIPPTWTTDVGVMNGNVLQATTHPATGHVVATVGPVQNSVVVNVVAGPLTRLAITPPNANVRMGGQQQFQVTGYDAFDNAVGGLTPTWQIVSPAAGTIDGNGLFTASRTQGTYPGAVSCSAAGQSAQASVVVGWPYSLRLPMLKR